jgi:phosphatidylglycerol:prolipoprotein diacylglycerol transferase
MHRELISIGAFKVHSYGFMLCVAFILGIIITYRHLKRNFLDPFMVYDIVIAALVGGIVGARIFYILGNLNEFKGHWIDILKFWNVEGLVFFGGLLLGAVLVILVIRWRGLPFPIVADGAGLSLALGLAVTRIGCFLNGCCFGKTSGLPWAVTFPEKTQVIMGMPANPVHPTQIYESLLDFALFIFLMVIRKRVKYHGEIFYMFLFFYGLIRFFVELFRYHVNSGAGLTFQIMSLALSAGAGMVLIFRVRLLPEVRP